MRSERNCYKDTTNVEARFYTRGSLKDDNMPISIGKNKKVIDIMKDKFGSKIMKEFVALRAKMYAYRKTDKKSGNKHCKGTKKVCS